MNTVQSPVWSGALLNIHFTQLAYAPEQICLPHHTFISHCTNTVLYVDPILLHTQIKKKQLTATLIYHINGIHMPHMHIISCAYETTVSVHIPHVSSMQSIMWPGGPVYIHFILLTHGPEQICLLHYTHVPLHFSKSLHIDPTLLVTSLKTQQTAAFI